MGALLPPSTNAQYEGSMFSAWLLTVLAVLTIVPGLIHTFLPDGGAGTIAGLDLSTNRRTVVGLFAWAGATQIALGLVMLLVSLRYRPLVPLLLCSAPLHAPWPHSSHCRADRAQRNPPPIL